MNALVSRLDKTLIRREFWENRSLWMVPTVVIGILTVLSLYMLIAIIVGHSQVVSNINMENGLHFQLDDLPDFRAAEPEQLAGAIKVITLLLGAMFSFIMKIVVFFYMLDSLYADRRDRSVLFWRSMPVSDTRTVLSKLVTAMFAMTGIAFAAAVTLELVLLVFFLILGAVENGHTWVLLTQPGAFIESWLLLVYGLVVQAVWLLPYYGWVLLASSWAKKAPFLWVVLVPLGIMGAEGWVFHSAHFARMVARHSLDWLPLAFNFDPEMMRKGPDMLVSGHLMGFENIGRLLAAPELWIGTALAAAFIYGAIWLRRNRSEI